MSDEMTMGTVLDIVLLVLLVAAVVYGARRGFIHTIGRAAGAIIGAAAALVVMPLVSTWVRIAVLNVVAAAVAGLLLVSLGAWVGSLFGGRVRHSAHKAKLGGVDRTAGAVLSGAVTWGTMLMVAMGAGASAVPGVAQAVASSQVLRMGQAITPDPVLAALARLRSTTVDEGIPSVLQAAGVGSGKAPDADADTEALETAARSAMRIQANSASCGVASTGSGFVFDDGYVMTNAHVVAGAESVTVQSPGDLPATASVVYFDGDADIAVLRVKGLSAAPLPFATDPDVGDTAFFQGYPYGGPFVSRSAKVLALGAMRVSDVTASHTVTRTVTTLTGTVQPGNSGGPLLNADGAVEGMIFAKSEASSNVGFALSMEELTPVIALAPTLTERVSTGGCTS